MPNVANRIDHAVVAYAGGDTGIFNASCGTPGAPDAASQEAAILIVGMPETTFVTHTRIEKSAKNGIERAWRGPARSFLDTNTFVDVPYCAETYPRPSDDSCPVPAPCAR